MRQPERRVPRRVLYLGFCLLLGNAGLVGLAVADEPAKSIYLAADDHTDYFWTADEETYRKAFIETIDYYLDLSDKTRDNPPDHQSRWNCDGSLWRWESARTRKREPWRLRRSALHGGCHPDGRDAQVVHQ